jgi:cold shock CspA family protein
MLLDMARVLYRMIYSIIVTHMAAVRGQDSTGLAARYPPREKMKKQKNDDKMICDRMITTDEHPTGMTRVTVGDEPSREPAFSINGRGSETCGGDAARVQQSNGRIDDNDSTACDSKVEVDDGRVVQGASEAATCGVPDCSTSQRSVSERRGDFGRLGATPCPVRRQGNDRTEVGRAKVAGAPGGYCMMMGGYGGGYQMNSTLDRDEVLKALAREGDDEHKQPNELLTLLILKLEFMAYAHNTTWRRLLDERSIEEIDQSVEEDAAWDYDHTRFGVHDDVKMARSRMMSEFKREMAEHMNDYEDAYEDRESGDEDGDAEGEYEGEIVYWNAEKGFGFLTDPDGDRIFFHVSGLAVKQDQTYLEECYGAGIFDQEVNFRYEWQEERQQYKAVGIYWRSYDYDSE